MNHYNPRDIPLSNSPAPAGPWDMGHWMCKAPRLVPRGCDVEIKLPFPYEDDVTESVKVTVAQAGNVIAEYEKVDVTIADETMTFTIGQSATLSLDATEGPVLVQIRAIITNVGAVKSPVFKFATDADEMTLNDDYFDADETVDGVAFSINDDGELVATTTQAFANKYGFTIEDDSDLVVTVNG